MSIGENIKKIRKARNLTQKQLGNLIDKKEITVRRYEKGDITPPIAVIKNIAEKFDIPIVEIIGDDPRSDINKEFVISEAKKYDNFNIGLDKALDELHKRPSEVRKEKQVNNEYIDDQEIIYKLLQHYNYKYCDNRYDLSKLDREHYIDLQGMFYNTIKVVLKDCIKDNK